MQQLDMIVYGDVQGVGFRFYIVNIANKLGLVGFVKNIKNESVQICAMGEQENLDLFLNRIKSSPFKIENIDISFSVAKRGFDNFSISY